MFGSKVIFVTKPSQVPNQDHYAIFKFFSISQSLYSPNDSSTEGCSYEAYLNKADWIEEIRHLENKKRNYGGDSYVAVKISAPAKIEVNVEIKE